MELLSVPRLLISGLSDGVGKAMIGIGLTHELRKRGVGISCAVVGPNLPQAIVYKRISGRFVRTLDDRLLSRGQMLASVYHAGVGADLLLIHGGKGADLIQHQSALPNSDVDLAGLTKTPVLLVVDATKLGPDIDSMIRSYAGLAGSFEIGGCIINRIRESDDKGSDAYTNAMVNAGLRAPVGIIPELQAYGVLPPRSIDLQDRPPGVPLQFFIDMGNVVSQYINIDELVERAGEVQSVRLENFEYRPLARRARIAVTDDSAFNICFQDNLDLMRFYGAEIANFSLLADAQIPRKCGALYLTGAFLREYASELSANKGMMKSIREFAERGGVIYSEGEGTAYLFEEFKAGEEKCQGVGLIEGCASFSSPGLQYTESLALEESILGGEGTKLRGIANGLWRLSGASSTMRALRISRGRGESVQEGYSPGAQVLATFCYNHFGSNPSVAKALVDASQVVQRLE